MPTLKKIANKHKLILYLKDIEKEEQTKPSLQNPQTLNCTKKKRKTLMTQIIETRNGREEGTVGASDIRKVIRE